MKLLCISLLFLCTSAMAESDMPEGATLDIPATPKIVNPTICKVTCKDTSRVNTYINQESQDVAIYGCGNVVMVNCGGDNGR